MVIFESLLASRSFKLKPEMDILSSIASYVPPLLGIYLGVKIVDLTIRDAWPFVFEGSLQSTMYIIELGLGVLIPMIILSIRKFRHSAGTLFLSAALVVLGVALNRIDMFLVAYKPLYADKPYFPSVFEISVTIGLICALILVYRAVVMIFPVIHQAPQNDKSMPGVYSENRILADAK
jgi:Ni/Fe-hydrogenase subunit HybB-like protein